MVTALTDKPSDEAFRWAERTVKDLLGRGSPIRGFEYWFGSPDPEAIHPLELEDYVGLTGLDIAAICFGATVPKGQRVYVPDAVLALRVGHWCAIGAYPHTARRAGFLPQVWTNSTEAIAEFTHPRWLSWITRVISPALEIPLAEVSAASATNRFARVALEYYAIGRKVPFGIDVDQFRSALSKGFRAHDPDHDEYAIGPALTLSEGLQFLEVLNGKNADVFYRANEGPLHLRWDGVHDILKRQLKRSRRRKESLLDDFSSHGDRGYLANEHDSPTHDAVQSHALRAFAERELRNLRDRIDRVPMMRKLVGIVLDCHDDELVITAAAEIRYVLDEFERIREVATRAAVMYEWGRSFSGANGSHGGWSREEVGDAFGVSTRQIELRVRAAADALRRVHRRAS